MFLNLYELIWLLRDLARPKLTELANWTDVLLYA